MAIYFFCVAKLSSRLHLPALRDRVWFRFHTLLVCNVTSLKSGRQVVSEEEKEGSG